MKSEKTNIKIEKDADDENNYVELTKIANNNIVQPAKNEPVAILMDRKKLIEDLLAAQTEKKKLYFETRKQAELIDKLKAAAIQDENRITTLMNQLSAAQTDVVHITEAKNIFKASAAQKEQQYQEKITYLSNKLKDVTAGMEKHKMTHREMNNLKRENKKLCAQTSQLQSEISVAHASRRHLESSMSSLQSPVQKSPHGRESDIFEVERILSHKMVKKRRQFLIRWKG